MTTYRNLFATCVQHIETTYMRCVLQMVPCLGLLHHYVGERCNYFTLLNLRKFAKKTHPKLMRSSQVLLMPYRQANLFASNQQQEAEKDISSTYAKKLRHYKMLTR